LTFKDLKRKVSLYQQEIDRNDKFFERLRGKPFWIWDCNYHRQEDIRTNGDCCFNHIIGLPKRSNEEKPFFDYEKIVFDSLVKNKHIWIKKATGLGITEFMLRYMAWLCLKDDRLIGTQMCIVTGPRIDLAITLIDRMKMLFKDRGLLSFSNKETMIELNGVRIEAYPSHHLDSMRGLTNISFILLDEADFFPPGQQQDARDVSERYIAKSDPYILMVSTPNAPGGLFERIEQEPEQTCIYKRIFLDYTYGLDKIYSGEEIEKAKQSPSFEREYNLKYLGLIGNTFHTGSIEEAVEKGKLYNPDTPVMMAGKAMGVDPAWGSSAFGTVIIQWVDRQVQILHAEEYRRPDYNEMLDITWDLIWKYNLSKIYVDGANPAFIRSLKQRMGENSDFETELLWYVGRYGKEQTQNIIKRSWKVVPVNFSQEHKQMLMHTKMILEKGYLVINPKFDKLITSLRTAIDNEGVLEKERTSYNDILDALRLSLKNVEFGKPRY
jgi:hypothetical protein